MTTTVSEIEGIESLTLSVTQEIHVNAPIDVTFEALLEQLGPGNEMPDGTPMPFKLEPRPGGRWFRDLGGDNGHFWGNVQAIKRPSLIEFTGPMFMSYPVTNHVELKVEEVSGGSRVSLRHRAVGLIDPEHRKNVGRGWNHMLTSVKKDCE